MTLDAGFSSPRLDAFPAGLRVLVVDDDPTWLKILEKMLKKCSYEVATCGLAIEALNLLREKKDGFDIVISDVNMPDMDGFKLLEHVGLEMDLPVIMMSVDGETSRVMKGVQHGACDYLLKPIRMKELRNIWQHVFRKKIQEVKDIENLESIMGVHLAGYEPELGDEGHSLCGEDLYSTRKRKDNENKHDGKEFCDLSTKKARVVWTVDLHQKFVDAVNQIGYDKVGPKKILDLMNVPWLTRENVASHLQKYRLYLTRLQKENDQKASSGGLKHSELSPKDPARIFDHQKPMEMHQTDVAEGNFMLSNNSLNAQNMEPQSREGNLKRSVLAPMVEPKRALLSSAFDPVAAVANITDPEEGNSSQSGFNSHASVASDVKCSSLEAAIPTQHAYSEVLDTPFKLDRKPLPLEDGFSELPLPGSQHHIQVDLLQSAAPISPMPSTSERDLSAFFKNRPLYADPGSSHLCPTELGINSFPTQSKTQMESRQEFEPIPASMLTMTNEELNLSSITSLESAQRSLVSGSELPAAASFGEDFKVNWVQSNYYTINPQVENILFSEYNNSEPVADLPMNFYDAVKSECDYLFDPLEFCFISQGLFA